MDNIIKIDLPEKCRILAVSDIHTHYALLERTLAKAEYKADEDYLIIVGDILEHGTENIDTIRYIMKLCSNERTYCLKGNNDTMVLCMAFKDTFERFAKRLEERPVNTFVQMAESIGITEFTENTLESIRKKVYNTYKSELDFLNDLPVALETDGHIFVHAGIENRTDWENTSNQFAMSQPWYLREKHCIDKMVVVGHYPTYNYKRSNNSNLPIIDYEKKMIDIDGGLTIKRAGQLNVFEIIKNAESFIYSTIWETYFEKKKAAKDFVNNIKPIYIDVDRYSLEIIGSKDGFTKLKVINTGETGYIINEQVNDYNGEIKVWQSLSAFPDLKKGEAVSLCGTVNDYCLIISASGQVGWVPKEYIED